MTVCSECKDAIDGGFSLCVPCFERVYKDVNEVESGDRGAHS